MTTQRLERRPIKDWASGDELPTPGGRTYLAFRELDELLASTPDVATPVDRIGETWHLIADTDVSAPVDEAPTHGLDSWDF